MTSTQRSPTTGDQAPDFTLPAVLDQNKTEGEFRLFDTLNKLNSGGVVLFFYPKDNTPGCTIEAIEFTENLEAFAKAGVMIIGISPDTIKMHHKFIDKQSLQVILVSDEEKNALEAYSVWVEKSMFGRKYMGVERSTFLINSKGTIAKAWRKVKVKGHVDEVLEAALAINV